MTRKYTQAQNRATQKYVKKTYDEFKIRMVKGKKAEYMEVAKSRGKSLNKYVLDLIEADIKRSRH